MSVRAVEEFADPDVDARRARAIWRRFAQRARDSWSRWIAADFNRIGLWTPAAIGAGAGVYFGLKSEPAAIIAVGALAASALAVWVGGRFRNVALGVFFVALGFAAADWRTAQVAAPALVRELDITTVTGRLVEVEDSAARRRLVLDLHAIAGLAEEELPARARITWRGAAMNAAPGDLLALRAGLSPPPPPAAPGTFDYARQLYFQRIGAVGFAVSEPVVVPDPGKSAAQMFAARIESLRARLMRRITAAAPSEGGAIVAAIVTGKRDAITDRARFALRDAGLAHLLAISGLHMGLATGLVFLTVRFGLAAIEPLALNFPIKKWAAIAALAAGFFYLVLSGGGWSARRAFIMTAIIFIAILFDRRALSLRNVAIAAAFILLTTPEALFHPGFQMSFAAVTALIAAYEWAGARADPNRSFTGLARLKRYAVGLAATDLIAALATAPFALYHFNRVALYSLPANVLAMPLMAFWIIPAAVAALVLAPLGLDGWAWRLSAAGVDTVLSIATEVSGWPGSVSLTPQWPLAALLALVLGGAWLCLAQSPLRLIGLAGVPLAFFIVRAAAPPDVYVAASGLNAAIVSKSGDGAVSSYSARRDRFSLSVWREEAGFEREAKAGRMADAGDCDRSGCVVSLPGRGVVAFTEDPGALAEDCRRADLVVAFFPVSGADWRACAATLVDRRSVWRRGAHAAWLEEGTVRLKTVAETRGRRPWTGAVQ